MSHEAQRQTLNELYKYDGYEGVVRYFADYKGMTRDEAEGASNAWGYSLDSSPEQLSLFPDTIIEDEVKTVEEKQPSLFKRLFGKN